MIADLCTALCEVYDHFGINRKELEVSAAE